MQRRNIALQAAVGFDGDETALGAQAFALSRNDLDVIGVDFGHDHGNVRGKAMRTVVGNHRAFSLGVSFLQRLDFFLLHVDSAEYKIYLRSHFFHVGSVQNDKFLAFSGMGVCISQRLPTAFS